MKPLVTVLIVSRNRPEELRTTLAALRRQTYVPLELLVIDDASAGELAPMVRRYWSEAVVVRNDTNRGLIACRSHGMRLANGEFILSLDDDSCLTDPADIDVAVARMCAERDVGILTFRVHHGAEVPVDAPAAPAFRYVHTYIGCGHMIRRQVVRQIGTYRDDYVYYGEETEYSLRALDAGWHILFLPAVLVHHRVSAIGRERGRAWGYSVRNNLWSILLRMPWRRVPIELTWKLGVNAVELIRCLEFRWAAWAFGSFLVGAPAVFRARRPISAETLRRYDALKFRIVSNRVDLDKPKRVSVRELADYFRNTWWHRRMGPPFWDRRSGGIGRTSMATFELDPRR